MSDGLRCCLVQADTLWHDPQANRDYYTQLLHSQAPQADLLVLPETFSSGFSNAAIAQAEGMDGPTVRWLRDMAAEYRCAITGSVQIQEQGSVYNRLLWAMPDGSLLHYDKRHLFRMADEHRRYAAGRQKLFVEYLGWRICPLVCYDLRFPVFSRNVHDAGRPGGYDYDLLIYVANWPAARHFAWQSLLKARAIENLSYVVGVNRTGRDGNGLDYLGGSVVHDFLGQTLLDLGERPAMRTAVLSKPDLEAFRRRFPAHLDADRFNLLD